MSIVLSGLAHPFQYICIKLLSSRNPTCIDNEPVDNFPEDMRLMFMQHRYITFNMNRKLDCKVQF
ncbi:hypothetical protein EMUR_01830 [Ehrlichia muris AS145]|uniref:Uncharacterized protein n=1 Tax=Ehrlichia muris AS145 TaxID=1423892 RepID=V9R7E2_9RICK|nr:hypothetical protein EMUR_01830 [Ehrlichia muris AS145]